MRNLSAVGVVIVLIVFSLATGVLAQDEIVQRSFAGDSVYLDLSSGSYRVTDSPDGRIRVIPRTKMDQVSIRLSVNAFGNRADVRVRGPRDAFEANIELPTRVNIVVAIPSGALRVSGIAGSKNISVKAGEIEVAIGNPQTYRRVVVSVQAGKLSAPMFPNDKRSPQSLEWTGNGEYDLKVRLDSGNVTLLD
jgi:hypothetical protein